MWVLLLVILRYKRLLGTHYGLSLTSLGSCIMLLVILLEGWARLVGVLSLRVSLCSSGWREFVHEFETPAEKGVRSLSFKELFPKYVLGKSNSQALSLILLMT